MVHSPTNSIHFHKIPHLILCLEPCVTSQGADSYICALFPENRREQKNISVLILQNGEKTLFENFDEVNLHNIMHLHYRKSKTSQSDCGLTERGQKKCLFERVPPSPPVKSDSDIMNSSNSVFPSARVMPGSGGSPVRSISELAAI